MSGERRAADRQAENSPPHDRDRDKRQPYAKEHEEYSGDGVVKPPKEGSGKRDKPTLSRKT